MIYEANDKYNAVPAQGYTVGETILYVNTVPINVPAIAVTSVDALKPVVYGVDGEAGSDGIVMISYTTQCVMI